MSEDKQKPGFRKPLAGTLGVSALVTRAVFPKKETEEAPKKSALQQALNLAKMALATHFVSFEINPEKSAKSLVNRTFDKNYNLLAETYGAPDANNPKHDAFLLYTANLMTEAELNSSFNEVLHENQPATLQQKAAHAFKENILKAKNDPDPTGKKDFLLFAKDQYESAISDVMNLTSRTALNLATTDCLDAPLKNPPQRKR